MAHKALTPDPVFSGHPADLVQRAIAILADAAACSQPGAALPVTGTAAQAAPGPDAGALAALLARNIAR